jgi:hypothetical protein
LKNECLSYEILKFYTFGFNHPVFDPVYIEWGTQTFLAFKMAAVTQKWFIIKFSRNCQCTHTLRQFVYNRVTYKQTYAIPHKPFSPVTKHILSSRN